MGNGVSNEEVLPLLSDCAVLQWCLLWVLYSDHIWKVIDLLESIAHPVAFAEYTGKEKSKRPPVDLQEALTDLLDHHR